MKQIGVFGGSFDPPHRAHERIARAACEQLGLDLLLWVPARQPPHKQDQLLAKPNDRLNMVQLLARDVPEFVVDAREIERAGPSWTVDTLESLHEDYPGAHFWLIVGSDNLAGFPSWRRPDRIRQLASLAVYERAAPPGHQEAANIPGRKPHALRIPGATLDISSTQIRHLLQSRQPTGDMLSPPVLDYIVKNGLYQ